jgi:hypothetical protein
VSAAPGASVAGVARSQVSASGACRAVVATVIPLTGTPPSLWTVAV